MHVDNTALKMALNNGNNNERSKEKRPLNEIYRLDGGSRTLLLTCLQLPESTTDNELLVKLDFIFNLIDQLDSMTNEAKELKIEMAKLTVNNLLNKGYITNEEFDFYLKLAQIDYRVAEEIAISNFHRSHELEELVKLSASKLYHSDGKLERLKELSIYHFEIKYNELLADKN